MKERTVQTEKGSPRGTHWQCKLKKVALVAHTAAYVLFFFFATFTCTIMREYAHSDKIKNWLYAGH